MSAMQNSAAQQGLNYEEMMQTAEATMAVDHEAMAAAAQAAARASEAAAAAQTNGEFLVHPALAVIPVARACCCKIAQ
jgi:hypothetical protein